MNQHATALRLSRCRAGHVVFILQCGDLLAQCMEFLKELSLVFFLNRPFYASISYQTP